MAIALTNIGVILQIITYPVATLDRHVREKLATVKKEPEVAEAMLNRFNRAMSDLAAMAQAPTVGDRRLFKGVVF